MTYKPISQKAIKQATIPYKKVLGFSRSNLLKLNTNFNIIRISLKEFGK